MSSPSSAPALGVRQPTVAELRAIAAQHHFTATSEQFQEWQPIINGWISSLDRVEALHAEHFPKQDVSQRDRGEAPKPDENRLNAWAWRCDIRNGDVTGGKLSGKTIAIKDNISVAGVPMRNGSKVLDGHVPTHDATVTRRVLAAGATIWGKSQNEDLCLSGASFTCAYGPVLNPHDRARNANGSSSGSSVLVAVGAVDMAVSVAQGGSVQLPAAACGVVGLKPTWGRIPYTGAFSMDATLDTPGPCARTCADAALLLEVLAGPDGQDSRCNGAPAPAAYAAALDEGIEGLRVGILKEGFGFPGASQQHVDDAVKAAAETLGAVGAVVKEVSVPMHLEASHIWTAVGLEGIVSAQFQGGGHGYNTTSTSPGAPALCQSWAEGLAAGADELSQTNKAWALAGQHVMQQTRGKYYAMGMNMCGVLKQRYDACLTDQCDVFVLPTLPMQPTPLVDRETAAVGDYFSTALGMIANTAPVNASRHPALTVPVPNVNGLPVGMMIVGKWWDEATLLRVGQAYETIRGPIVPPAEAS